MSVRPRPPGAARPQNSFRSAPSDSPRHHHPVDQLVDDLGDLVGPLARGDQAPSPLDGVRPDADGGHGSRGRGRSEKSFNPHMHAYRSALRLRTLGGVRARAAPTTRLAPAPRSGMAAADRLDPVVTTSSIARTRA